MSESHQILQIPSHHCCHGICPSSTPNLHPVLILGKVGGVKGEHKLRRDVAIGQGLLIEEVVLSQVNGQIVEGALGFRVTPAAARRRWETREEEKKENEQHTKSAPCPQRCRASASLELEGRPARTGSPTHTASNSPPDSRKKTIHRSYCLPANQHRIERFRLVLPGELLAARKIQLALIILTIIIQQTASPLDNLPP
jgi:hypothetical protein